MRVSLTALSLAVSFWLVAFDNRVFWRGIWAALEPASARSVLSVGLLALSLWLLFGLIVRLLCSRWTAKPVATVLLIVAALAAYFIEAYGIVIDRGMVRNVFGTDRREAADLLTAPLFWDLAWRGLLPVALLCMVRIERTSWRDAALGVAGQAAAVAVVLGVAATSFFAEYASMARNHRELRHMLTPTNVVNGLAGLWKERAKAPRELTMVAQDAMRTEPKSRAKPLVVVLVVGETARAASFSLGGYERPTNDALDGKGVVYFGNTTACGTDTATSLPCMFSNLGATGFAASTVVSRENVLDVLARTGIGVRWLENNSGCKGVCDWVDTQTLSQSEQPGVCDAGECLDAVLVDGLRDALAKTSADSLLALHMRGSHGPAYFKRVPDSARRYTPTCDTRQIQNCDLQALRNTYDNSIVYTSQTLAQLIDELAVRADVFDSALLYVSDHGESLGEKGVYLHGMPKWMAPREQTHVPMLVWLSEGAEARLGIERLALEGVAGGSYSHDNLFHTLLGAFALKTDSYRPEMDLLQRARIRPRPLAGAESK